MESHLDRLRKEFGKDSKFQRVDMQSGYIYYIIDTIGFLRNPKKYSFFWEDNSRGDLFDQREYFEGKFSEDRWAKYLKSPSTVN